jgi:hypothetical protein
MHHHGNSPHGHHPAHGPHGHHHGRHHDHQPGGPRAEQGLSSPVGEGFERSGSVQAQQSTGAEGCPKRGGTGPCSKQCRTCAFGESAS